MPTVRRSRTVSASLEDLWAVISDPHHLARWWPRVSRVEAVEGDTFTEVLTTQRGRALRADFRVIAAEPPRRIGWAQELEGTPFARVLRASETEVLLTPGEAGTEVTLELRQSLQGFFSRLGGFLVRRAGQSTLDEALDGLVRIVG